MNKYELSKRLNEYNNKRVDSIKKIYTGSIALLTTTPICIYNISLEDLPVVALAFLELGIITIPIIGIKDIIKTKKEIKLIKENKNNHSNNLNKVINAYKIVQTDLNNQIESENNKSKKKVLKKLRNNIKKYSEHS